MTASVHVRLERNADAVAVARDAALAFRSVLSPQRLEDIRLVVSQLVANSVIHGRGPIVDLRLRAEGSDVRGEVVDDGDGFAPPPPPTLDQPGGRGLAIVGALTRSWGIERGSTHVWFELADAAGEATLPLAA